MTKRSYLRHPVKMTDVAYKTLRCRLSLKETQTQFAKRFRVSVTTIVNWETGSVENMSRIYEEIMDSLTARLAEQGRLMPDASIRVLFKEEMERVGDAII
jgi:DNA-binding XRE family transcriptional regulator